MAPLAVSPVSLSSYLLFTLRVIHSYSLVNFIKMSSRNDLASVQTLMTENAFWKAVDILLKKPHVVNKRLWGCKLLFKTLCKPEKSVWKLPSNCKKFEDLNNIEQYKIQVLQNLQMSECKETDGAIVVEILLIELLPKAYKENHAFQLVLLSKQNVSVTFFDVTCKIQNINPNFDYTFKYENSEVIIQSECYDTKSYQWLKTAVLTQFIKWGEESTNQNVCNESLALVCHDKYYQKYNELKTKYGKEMVKIWPECTDPSKFVYEDVAIATYLLLLWEHERNHMHSKSLQSFTDLGCGNGLLVYILSKEGHPGVGIDVRKRQIWDIYPNVVKLEEKTITPSDVHLFPDTDWIIGNHSDELTPWIPVIAARSSYNCNFFLLPCCAYNFDGSKYRRQNSALSQYTEYLHYIKHLCELCGFKTDIDRLKIPSTKRICLVGRGRTYSNEEHNKYCDKIHCIINTETSTTKSQSEHSWINDFKPREATERVRNCTQLDKNLIASIVDKISHYLLTGYTMEGPWYVGKTAELNEVVELIPQEKLKSLKSECGGLQTLLKNHHHIFKVQGGKVQLRYPKTVDEVNNSIKINKTKGSNVKLQQKPCWFYKNHPQGCPLDDRNCSFLHVKC